MYWSVLVDTDKPNNASPKREGAYAYLRKPFQLKQFLSILKDAIEHTRMRYGYQYQERDGRGAREAERGM